MQQKSVYIKLHKRNLVSFVITCSIWLWNAWVPSSHAISHWHTQTLLCVNSPFLCHCSTVFQFLQIVLAHFTPCNDTGQIPLPGTCLRFPEQQQGHSAALFPVDQLGSRQCIWVFCAHDSKPPVPKKDRGRISQGIIGTQNSSVTHEQFYELSDWGILP